MVLNLYMKSGNKIPCHGIKTWKIETVGNGVNRFEINYLEGGSGERVVVQSIDLSQIECITVES